MSMTQGLDPLSVPAEPFAERSARADAARRVTFLINSMEGGGAERAMANLLSHLRQPLSGWDVELVLLDDLPVVQDIPEWVDVVTLDGRGSMFRSARQLARHLRRNPPSVCVSYLARSNCLNVLLSPVSSHRAVISERVQTSSHLATSRVGALYRGITRLAYPRAASVIAVSGGVADDLVANFAVPRDKTVVIGNPIDAAALETAAQEPPATALPDRFILAVGRMVVNKNFEMLIEGYDRVRPEEDLVILGEGPERPKLEAMVSARGLQGRVHMPGFVKNPYPVMARAAYLVSCSNAEGFPNTIIEAMTLGLPVIATDCPSGPFDVLRGEGAREGGKRGNARDGLLIPMNDVDALADGMMHYSVAVQRADYAARAKERARDFGVETVVEAYLNVIEADQPVVSRPERDSSQ
ncbi:N-acetylgalactosamine-N,N'-diacetylbacillosaminyl-diphospho-undecaprenol 4-alpha-N-acetylgalactosaminyltransferase [Aliiruegeria haliotis]|uniref:N-acetylgalactosamine-N, N'-diacetylbacillosaminyl-diphospho-undecaprenol 4-alpha-N-acetylgalactosaminyltransferase n=1 Tax=Aliiruegeria haliotis TaxID=1280846 RepID=A0A2T0S074_9RHOB|nr:glycosyltransferase [Aliiruegeria haliotis]PRY26824.1 N-acetylgalactosamine-N,N'-diacetylbacillosaminyl-diphospho-undecaprenol 4-alpha-N-acetylgalactosaminyltransferase [Aliiruegeria haliotis]